MATHSSSEPLSSDLLLRKYEFPSEVLDIIISGKSALDSTQTLHLSSMEEVERFISGYGFNLENPIEKAEATGNFQEALSFIRKYFLQPENPEGLSLEVPRRIAEISDVRELFLFASLRYPGQMNDAAGLALQNWACALLKIMHTIAHIDQDLRSSYFADIQKQILDRYYKLIHRDENERLYMADRADDPMRVDLVEFESKPKKSRDSILLKLLHKPENVAEDIFDRVGLRFVTHTRIDCLRLVKFLKEKTLVMPPNIKPSRSRNTLVDLDKLRQIWGDIRDQVQKGQMNEKELVSRLELAGFGLESEDGKNIHSSKFYKAIQFTARQLIKLKSSIYSDLRDLKSQARKSELPEDVSKLIERIDLKYAQKEIRFFYPYEVQVLDRASFEENEKGRSAHSEYKRAQLQTALRRVMGPLAGPG
jgi:uncharacterized protein (TIGR04562 family)